MDIEFQFNSQTIDPESVEGSHIKALRLHAVEFAHILDMFCPESREKSLALTNLEQSLMWAVKSITHNPEDESVD